MTKDTTIHSYNDKRKPQYALKMTSLPQRTLRMATIPLWTKKIKKIKKKILKSLGVKTKNLVTLYFYLRNIGGVQIQENDPYPTGSAQQWLL